jgi:hypothetical protein
MSVPAPHGSTQTPIDARYKREGGGSGAHATPAAAMTAAPRVDDQEEDEGPAAAPQPQNLDSDREEDAQYARDELRKLVRQASSGVAAAGKASPQAAAASQPQPQPQEQQKQQKQDDQAVGAADAGATAVELVEGVVEAAARKLGIGGGAE